GPVHTNRVTHNDPCRFALARQGNDRSNVVLTVGVRDRGQRHGGQARSFTKCDADARRSQVEAQNRAAHALPDVDRASFVWGPATDSAFERRPIWYSTKACVIRCRWLRVPGDSRASSGVSRSARRRAKSAALKLNRPPAAAAAF